MFHVVWNPVCRQAGFQALLQKSCSRRRGIVMHPIGPGSNSGKQTWEELPVYPNLKIPLYALFLPLNSNLTMFKQVLALTLALALLIACKSEHPDLKTAYELFKDGFEQHSYIITHSAELKNEAKLIDSRIRNEDKENVFAISEVYNHLDQVDGGLQKMVGRIQAVPGHEKESFGAPVLDKKLEPAQILMIQKNYRDSVLLIKNELDAATTLLNALKTKLN
jgi:hypothetical protein